MDSILPNWTGYYGNHRNSWPPDVESRFSSVERRAVEVFGNSISAGVWMSNIDTRIGNCQIRDAITSETGSQRALEILDELANSITPTPYEVPRRSRRRR